MGFRGLNAGSISIDMPLLEPRTWNKLPKSPYPRHTARNALTLLRELRQGLSTHRPKPSNLSVSPSLSLTHVH